MWFLNGPIFLIPPRKQSPQKDYPCGSLSRVQRWEIPPQSILNAYVIFVRSSNCFIIFVWIGNSVQSSNSFFLSSFFLSFFLSFKLGYHALQIAFLSPNIPWICYLNVFLTKPCPSISVLTLLGLPLPLSSKRKKERKKEK